MKLAYEENRVLVLKDKSNNDIIVGVIVYELDLNKKCLSFGPFALKFIFDIYYYFLVALPTF